MIKSYPKILPLVGKYADQILNKGLIEITEKIDGSAFAFGKDEEGKLYMRSKGTQILFEEKIDDLFRPAVTHVLDVQDKIPNNRIYYCETLKNERHNTLVYNRIPRNHLMVYGISDFHGTEWVPEYFQLQAQSNDIDLDPVPFIGYVEITDLSQIAALLERESALGGPKIEGVVLKTYNHGMQFGGMMFPFVTMKFVSDEFKEKHADNPDYVPQRNKTEEVIRRYKTEARWLKAVQHLRDKGELVHEPKDIGSLMKELHNDLVEEEKENFKEELYQIYQKDWKNIVCAGFPQWYKEQLLKA